jgi:hypothetical protein
MTEVCVFTRRYWNFDFMKKVEISVHNNFSRDFLHCLKYLLKRKFPDPGWRFLVTSFQWGCLANQEHWLLILVVALRQTSDGASQLLCAGRPCCRGINMHWTSGFTLSSSALGIMPWPHTAFLYTWNLVQWVYAIIQSSFSTCSWKF